jgi:hypothetical protein
MNERLLQIIFLLSDYRRTCGRTSSQLLQSCRELPTNEIPDDIRVLSTLLGMLRDGGYITTTLRHKQNLHKLTPKGCELIPLASGESLHVERDTITATVGNAELPSSHESIRDNARDESAEPSDANQIIEQIQETIMTTDDTVSSLLTFSDLPFINEGHRDILKDIANDLKIKNKTGKLDALNSFIASCSLNEQMTEAFSTAVSLLTQKIE